MNHIKTRGANTSFVVFGNRFHTLRASRSYRLPRRWAGIDSNIATFEQYLARRTGVQTIQALTGRQFGFPVRSEEHTSELQSRQYLVCRLLLEKKKQKYKKKKIRNKNR